MNIATVYLFAVMLALVVGAPVVLLLPIILPAVVSLPEAPYAPSGGRIEARATARAEKEARACAPFVKVYAARGAVASRPAQTPCASRPTAKTVDRHGKPLQGAALRACRAKAGHVCMAHSSCLAVSS